MIEAASARAQEKFTYGMVGGGPGAFIGAVHRASLNLGGKAQLVCGCFSRNAGKNRESGEALSLDPGRVYENYIEMAQAEAERPDRPDFIVVATPNDSHYDICRAFLDRGFSVMCEKPMTIYVEHAYLLQKAAARHNCVLGVSYVYTGHIMAKMARRLIRDGAIGEIRMVMAEYPQQWLIDAVEGENKQAAWRTDPAQSGQCNCVGDIGSHIESLVHYMTGLKIEKLCANLDIFGEGRTLDTNASILLKYEGGASGVYWCSQVAAGYENALRVRIFGTEGTVEFEQEKSNFLTYIPKGKPAQVLVRGGDYLPADLRALDRLPAGHPEGYHEALANIYDEFLRAVAAKRAGEEICEADFDFPGAEMGIDGVWFIEKCAESTKSDTKWIKF